MSIQSHAPHAHQDRHCYRRRHAVHRHAWAQAWPSKPIKIVVGYPAGGLTDLFARAYGEYISQQVGQPVVVENKPGAGGSVGAQAVKAARPTATR